MFKYYVPCDMLRNSPVNYYLERHLWLIRLTNTLPVNQQLGNPTKKMELKKVIIINKKRFDRLE